MANPLVQSALRSLDMGRSRFLYGLEKTPDDRLNWSPGGSARSPLQQADRTAQFLTFVSYWLKHRAMPEQRPAPPPPSQSREEASRRVAAGFDQLSSTIASLTEEELAKPITMPWREEMALGDAVGSVPGVVGYLQGQLNYIQLAYGDEDPNIPPEWGSEG